MDFQATGMTRGGSDLGGMSLQADNPFESLGEALAEGLGKVLGLPPDGPTRQASPEPSVRIEASA